MTSVKTALGAIALMAMAIPASAHNGDHSLGFVATAMHWLSSPTHSLFAVIAGIGISAAIFKLARKWS